MTASEIVMKREDVNIAWGFRLTGGADLGTPFFVVKVSRLYVWYYSWETLSPVFGHIFMHTV